jgi:polyhydroxyalkanoate synthase subunit PhaC
VDRLRVEVPPVPHRGGHSWLFRRIAQAYLAALATAEDLVTDVELDWASEGELRFGVENIADALAPSNFPWSNPTALTVTVDYGGANLLAGARNLLRDMSTSSRLPASVDTSKFTVGVSIAATPGSVVHRTEVFELIQYAPSIDTVREVPIMIVPPTINKYYAWDLSPGRSIIEWFAAEGMSVLALVAEPDRRPGALQPRYLCRRVCRGGQGGGGDHRRGLAARDGRLLRRPDRRRDRRASRRVGPARERRQPRAVRLRARQTPGGRDRGRDDSRGGSDRGGRFRCQGLRRREGSGADLRVAAPERHDLDYWVNNYLLGALPPAFDILYWNQDSIRMAAGLHGDMVRVAVENSMCIPRRLDGPRHADRSCLGRCPNLRPGR